MLMVVFLILASCGNLQENGSEIQEPQTAENLLLDGNYLVMQVRSEDIASQEVVFLFNDKVKQLSANAGCNRFRASYDRTGKNITFEEAMSTKMYCEGKMQLENELISLLPHVSEIKKMGNEIGFYSEDNEQLLTLRKTGNREEY